MPTDRRPGLAALLLALGCASAPGTRETPAPAAAPAAGAEERVRLRVPRLRIVDAKLGEERSARREPIVVPFGINQNGTELVYALLERAGEKGAAAVGELAVYMTFRWRGGPVECRSRVFLEGDPQLTHAAAAAPSAATRPTAYDTQIDAYQPQRVEFVAEDRELQCETRRVPVTRKRRIASASDRSSEASRLGDLPTEDEEIVTSYETHDECRWVQVTRQASRYDYEVKLGFVPPNWAHLGARFARRAIVPAAPRCYSITDEELARQPIYRLTATAYHRGPLRLRAPRSLPSRAAVDAQAVTGSMSEAQCEKMMHAAFQKKSATALPEDVGGIYNQCRQDQVQRNKQRARARAALDGDDEVVDAYEELEDEPPFDAD